MVVYTDVCVCVPLFHFSFVQSSEMQFGVIYLKKLGGTQPYVAFSTLYIYIFLLVEHTWHRILLQCISQCLCQVFLVGW